MVVQDKKLVVPQCILHCQAFQLNVSFSDLAGMVSILTWIQGTFDRELRQTSDNHWVHACKHFSRKFLISPPAKLILRVLFQHI
uniref:LOX4 n=1 Tax=Arundo donax TaxID=35708 RepID=A0A0A9DFJ6_ARUDO